MGSIRVRCSLLAALIFLSVMFLAVSAAPPASQVVATIDGEPVLASEAIREYEQAYGKLKVGDDEKPRLLKRALEQVIDRRLAMRRLVQLGEAASQADVDQAFSRLEKQLAAQNIKPAEHYQRIGMTPEEVRRSLLWTLSWQRYLAKQLTGENLARYFERHRRDYDGTQLKVAHILIAAQPSDASAVQAAMAKARKARDAVVAGKQSFAEAAQAHSAGPSAKDGGDIGWIERREPMPEPFSQAAFALQAGELSQPVTTTFGVHLIQVTEVKPGQRTWQDAAEELKAAMTVHVFRWLADKERADAKVERMGQWP